MVDVREDILARLLAVVATIPNIKTAVRGDMDLTPEHLPAAVVMDGDEETNDASDVSMRPPNRPTVVQMTPEIILVESEAGEIVDIGTLRREVIKRVLTDTDLNENIVKTGRHGNGAIRYLGCQTDVGWMRSLHGALRAQFLFKYTLRPEDL